MSLEKFVTETRQIEIGGKHVAVRPLRVRQIPPFARAVGPVAGALLSGNLVGALTDHGDGLIQAMSVATGESSEWLGELDADEFIHLVGNVVEVNADFFAQRVTPTLTATVNSLTTAMSGLTPSPSLPAPVSASTPPST